MYKMKSVELNFVYLREGCSKTLNQINNAIPHTWIDMEYRGAQIHPVHYLNKKRVPFVALDSLKTATFSRKDKSENTFIKLCPLRVCTLGNDKVRNFFVFRTTLSQGIAQKNIEFIKYVRSDRLNRQYRYNKSHFCHSVCTNVCANGKFLIYLSRISKLHHLPL